MVTACSHKPPNQRSAAQARAPPESILSNDRKTKKTARHTAKLSTDPKS